MSPEQIAEIRAELGRLPPPDLDDPDNPEWTEEDFARAIPAEQMSDEDLAGFPKTLARLGRPRSDAAKIATKLRIDPDIVEAYKAAGPGWQTRMNAALRKGMPAPAKRTAQTTETPA